MGRKQAIRREPEKEPEKEPERARERARESQREPSEVFCPVLTGIQQNFGCTFAPKNYS